MDELSSLALMSYWEGGDLLNYKASITLAFYASSLFEAFLLRFLDCGSSWYKYFIG